MSEQWIAALIFPPIAAWVSIAALRRSRWAAVLADHPNERSLHLDPTPRVGGLGLMAGALPVAAWAANGTLGAILVCALALALLSLADDVRSLPVPVRLSAHVAAAAVAMLMAARAGSFDPQWPLIAIAVVAVAWMTNLYNFMDGSDGLAGGMAAIGFGTLAIGAWEAAMPPLAIAAAAFSTASLGFLAHNFPPARVFMGDAGSIPLGFLAGALGALGCFAGAWSPAFVLLAFSPFIVDATATLVKRLARGERVWAAHRSHYYQRLVLAGWPRRRLALAAWALMLASGASALAARAAGHAQQFGIILGWAVLYALLLVAIDRRLQRLGRAAMDRDSPGRSNE